MNEKINIKFNGRGIIMYKIILWGMGNEYESILNQINFERYKNNILVVGVVVRYEDKFCEYRDGFKIITKDEIGIMDYDYVVVTSSKYYLDILNEALNIGVKRNVIINGKVMKLPLFDFGKYISLIQNRVTILSDDCFAGYVYNRLGLEFSSPLINIQWDLDEYVRFIEKPFFYLDTPLQEVEFGDIDNGKYPVAKLGNDSDYVYLKLIHNVDFNSALTSWKRRIKRINRNNLVIKMSIPSIYDDARAKKYIDAFEKINYKKILIFKSKMKIDGALNTNRFVWSQKNNYRVSWFDFNDYFRAYYYYDIDIISFLLGDSIDRYGGNI